MVSPGHGDLYPAILGSGMLDRLLKGGYLYLFVSNSITSVPPWIQRC
jgi:UDP-N-acetylglucosamine pyrophosphorylase